MDWDADIDAIFRAVGAEPMVFEGVTVDAIPYLEDGTILSGDGSDAMGRELSVQVRDSAVPGIKRGSTVTFRGTDRKVRKFERSGDGRVVTLFLGT